MNSRTSERGAARPSRIIRDTTTAGLPLRVALAARLAGGHHGSDAPQRPAANRDLPARTPQATADTARAPLKTMGPGEQEELLALLQVRVEIACQGMRTDPGEAHVEGVLPQAVVDAWEGTWQDSHA